MSRLASFEHGKYFHFDYGINLVRIYEDVEYLRDLNNDEDTQLFGGFCHTAFIKDSDSDMIRSEAFILLMRLRGYDHVDGAFIENDGDLSHIEVE